jgi:hypothetical protein
MGFLALAAPLVSGVIGAVGAVASGMAQKNAAEYQAQVARNNAIAAENMRKYEIQKGLLDAEEQDRQNADLKGKQQAAMAASGFDMNEGTMREIGVSQTILGRTDSLRRAHAGELAGWKLQGQANNFRAEAQLAESKGKNAMLAGFIGAGSSLIGGAGGFASKWAGMSSTGSSSYSAGGTSYQSPTVYGTLY